jgi:hypothetical protein
MFGTALVVVEGTMSFLESLELEELPMMAVLMKKRECHAEEFGWCLLEKTRASAITQRYNK